MRLVIDTNIVIGDLLHRVTKLRNPAVKTALQEAIAAGVVIAYAPELLVAEVEGHFDELARKHRVDVNRVRVDWAEYRKSLRIVPVGEFDVIVDSAARRLRDPNDLTFLLAQEQLGSAAIVSRDPDIAAAGVRVLSSLDCIMDLRDYARNRSVELKIKLGGLFTITIGMAVVKAITDVVGRLGSALLALPPWAKVLLLATLALLFLMPKARERISAQFGTIANALGGALESVAPLFLELAEQLHASESGAAAALKRVTDAIPQGVRITVKPAAYAVVAAAETPLSAKEILDAVHSTGYVSRSKNALRYLRRVLRGDERFHEVEPDLWRLRAA